MKKANRTLSVILALAMLSTTTAFAGIQKVINEGVALSVSGTSSTGVSGERFSVVLHDNYNSEAPVKSAKGAWQGISGKNGEWTLNIPLAEGITYDNISLQYGDKSGAAQLFEVIGYADDITFSIKNTGHIFFGAENAKISVQINNATFDEHKYDIYTRVYEEGKDVLLYEGTHMLTALAQTNQRYTIPVDMTKSKLSYGMFEIQVAAIKSGDTVTDTDFSDRIRFSVAKKNTEQNSKLGIHTQFGHGYADPAINAALLKNAGFSGIRDYLAYSQCITDSQWKEPVRYNGWVDDINKAGLSQIIQLSTTDVGFPETEEELDEYVIYATKVAENLTEDGIYMYELGNELNWSVSAESYAELLIRVAPAIHNVDKDAKVLAFAVAGIGNYHAVNWIINVIDVIKSKGLDPHDYIDYITVHPYKPLNQHPEKAERTCGCTYGTESYPELTEKEETNGKEHPDPKDTIKGDSSLKTRMKNLDNRLNAVGCDDIPVIATEIGWYSYVGASSQKMCEKCAANEVTSLDETGQANYTIRAVALLHNSLEQIYFHTLNNKKQSASTMEKNFGFTENWLKAETEIPYEAKPVYIAIANFNSMLSNATLSEENVSGEIYDYVFEKDGKRIHLMWTTSTSSEVTFDESDVLVTDIYGNKIGAEKNSDGVYKLSLSGSPIYVEELSEYELQIKNASGTVMEKIGTETEAFASIIMPNQAEEQSVLICASYKDGRVLNIVSTNVEVGVNSTVTEKLQLGDADEVKAFHWTFGQLTPYTEAKVIRK